MRADSARLAQQRINEALEDLGLVAYTVTEVVREVGSERGMDVYSITLLDTASSAEFSTRVMSEQ